MSERSSYVLPGIALILIGFAIGWLLQGARQEVQPKRTRIETPTKTSRVDERLKLALDELSSLTDPDTRLAAVERIPPGEMRAYLQGLRNRAGLRGLKDRDRALLTTMLGVWHAQVPNDALTWILAHEDAVSRASLIFRLLQTAGPADPIWAMKLVVETSSPEIGYLQIPAAVLDAAAGQGADSLLECLKLAAHPDRGGYECRVEFPADFDFAGFAAGFAEHLAGLPKGTRQMIIPVNLEEDWARSDPVPAFLWAVHHPDEASANGLESAIGVIVELPSSRAGAVFAHAVRVEAADPGPVFAGLIRALDSEPNPAILAHFLDAFESPDDREAHLRALFRNTMVPQQDLRSPTVRHLILSHLTAEERLAFLQGIQPDPGASSKPLHIDAEFTAALQAELERLSHTSEEIAVMMEHFKPNPAPSRP